jgi:uncharacterized metal-binding protein
MADNPPCTCGTCGGNEPKRVIFPCAGQANVGQVTNQAALQLTAEGYGRLSCLALLATGDPDLAVTVKNADEVVVLDGCPKLCGKKIADAQGVAIGQHLVLTSLGIQKGPSLSYTPEDVEQVVSTCWKGEGRTGDRAGPGQGPGSAAGCGCDCGCSGRR